MNCAQCRKAAATIPFMGFGLCPPCHKTIVSYGMGAVPATRAPSPYSHPLIFDQGLCNCDDNSRCNACLKLMLRQEREALEFKTKCECGNSKNPRGQGHSYWCKLYAKEFASTTR